MPGAQEKEKSKVGLTLFIRESESVTICYRQPELEISTSCIQHILFLETNARLK